MHLFLGVSLALCTLSLVSPAPIQEQGKRDMEDPDFQAALEDGYSLIIKILNAIPTAHTSWIPTDLKSLSLNSNDTSRLKHLKEELNLPTAPALKPVSEDFTLADSLNQIAKGLKLHQTLLTVVCKLFLVKSYPDMSQSVDDFLFDIRDLLAQVNKMKKMVKVESDPDSQEVSERQLLEEDLAPRLKDEYKTMVAVHQSLLQLQDFSRNVSRSFKSMISSSDDSETQPTLR